MNKKLLKASKEYLNGTPKLNDGEVLPLIEFKYGGVGRIVVSNGFSIVSFIVPDGCLGLFIGNAIKNPISLRRRVVRAYGDVCSLGVRLYFIGYLHSIRVYSSKKVRKYKGLFGGGI